MGADRPPRARRLTVLSHLYGPNVRTESGGDADLCNAQRRSRSPLAFDLNEDVRQAMVAQFGPFSRRAEP